MRCLLILNKANIFCYRIAKIIATFNCCNASVQYFAILHAQKYCTMSIDKTVIASMPQNIGYVQY